MFSHEGILFVGDSLNASMTTGLTINQGAQDDEIFSLKSSDVAHGMTSITETDTFMKIAKIGAATGGAHTEGLGEGEYGIWFTGTATSPDNTISAAGTAPVIIRAQKKSGTTAGALGASENVLAIRNAGSNVAIFGQDGDLYLDTFVNTEAWDDYDDIQLLHAVRGVNNEFFKQNFRKAIEYGRPILEKTGVIKYNDDGHHFMSTQGVMALTIDAVRQVATKVDSEAEKLKLAYNRIDELESQVALLKA